MLALPHPRDYAPLVDVRGSRRAISLALPHNPPLFGLRRSFCHVLPRDPCLFVCMRVAFRSLVLSAFAPIVAIFGHLGYTYDTDTTINLSGFTAPLNEQIETQQSTEDFAAVGFEMSLAFHHSLLVLPSLPSRLLP